MEETPLPVRWFQGNQLIREPSEAVVNEAIKRATEGQSSLGPDGIPKIVDRLLQDELVAPMLTTWRSQRATGYIPPPCIHGARLGIPKPNLLATVDNFRPLELMNNEMKILSTAVLIQLEAAMQQWIPQQ